MADVDSDSGNRGTTMRIIRDSRVRLQWLVRNRGSLQKNTRSLDSDRESLLRNKESLGRESYDVRTEKVTREHEDERTPVVRR